MASMPLGLNHQQPQAVINEPQKLVPRRSSQMDSDKVTFTLSLSLSFLFFTVLPPLSL